MDDGTVDRFIPEHPLPKEIQEMKKDDTVCQFCGVSYLIHNEMKALEERVKEAEKQMEYYKGSVQREEQLKIKVASMEEESDKLSRALQASEQRTNILAVDLTSKQEQIEELKKQNNDLELDLHVKQREIARTRSKMSDLIRFIPSSQMDIQMQRTALVDMKHYVQENSRVVMEHIGNVSTNAALLCKKFTEETCNLKDNLKKGEDEKKFLEEAFGKSEASVQEFGKKCTQLEGKVSEKEKELARAKEQIDSCSNEIACYKELIKSKSNDLKDYKEKLQNQAETFRQEVTKKEDNLLSKEKQIRQLLENCENLEKRIAEFTKSRDKEQEKSLNTAEEMNVLRASLTKAKDEAAALRREREMMISAHHNRIEQLRESFKKKMEEADAWPSKLDKIVKEKEAQFLEEKNNLWKELTDAFQKEMDEDQRKHIDELAAWRKEAKAAQDKFREDITTLNRKHREEVKRLEQAVNEAKEKTEQSKNASNSIIQNLQAKVVDLENRMRHPSAESVEQVSKLRAKLQESERSLREAEKQIEELETKKESWRQEKAFLQETVRQECEERLELTDALGEARAQLLAFQRDSIASLSRTNSLDSTQSMNRGSAKGVGLNGLHDSNGTHASACSVGFDAGVGHGSGSRSSHTESVNDSRQRIAAAVRRSGSKSRLGGNFSS